MFVNQEFYLKTHRLFNWIMDSFPQRPRRSLYWCINIMRAISRKDISSAKKLAKELLEVLEEDFPGK